MFPHLPASRSNAPIPEFRKISKLVCSRQRRRRLSAVILIVALTAASVPLTEGRSLHKSLSGHVMGMSHLALQAWSNSIGFFGLAQQQDYGMPGRPSDPPREEPRAPLTKAEKEVRVAQLRINMAAESWIASKQRFAAGAVGNSVNFIDAFQTLHELVHHAGSKDYYSDPQVAEALFKKTGTPGLPKRKDFKKEQDFIKANSSYFSKVLRANCPVLTG